MRGDRRQSPRPEEDVLSSVVDNDGDAGVSHHNLSLVSGSETHCEEDVAVKEERVW